MHSFSRRIRARALFDSFPLGTAEGRRSADRRIQPLSAPHNQMLPPECARARKRAQRGALASRRSTADLAAAANAATRPRPRLTRPGGRGRYPRHRSRLSQAPGSPVVMPAGTMPEPPGSGVCRSARRNRSRSAFRSTLAKGVPHDSMSGIGALLPKWGRMSREMSRYRRQSVFLPRLRGR